MEQRAWIEEQGWRLVLIHMSHDEEPPPLLEGLDDDQVDHINDPHCELYRSFGLAKGSFMQLFGANVLWRGLRALFEGHGAGKLNGDGMQMPGMFLVSNGRIIKSHRARHSGDHPDLKSFAIVKAS